jgi:hypothetical protein
MSKITSIEQAARLARAMASDITIYNGEKIRRGIENDRLFEELEDDLREAVQLWSNRVSEDIVSGTNLLQKAVIDQIFAPHTNVHSRIF